MSTSQRYSLKGLYGITDAKLMSKETVFSQVEQALLGGAAVIQYRDKHSDNNLRLNQARQLTALCQRYERPLLINDDVELAVACGAAGVHLGQQDGSVAEARQKLGKQAIIGVTCHSSLELALSAQAEGADYVAFGAFYPSSTKPNATPAPIELLTDAHQQLQIPVVAIGGITVDNARQLIEPGADMIAVVHSLFAADDITDRARRFCRLFS